LNLPDFVQDRIKKIVERTKISVDEVKKDYMEIFNDDFTQNDPQFVTDLQRHSFTIMVLIARTRIRRPQGEPLQMLT